MVLTVTQPRIGIKLLSCILFLMVRVKFLMFVSNFFCEMFAISKYSVTNHKKNGGMVMLKEEVAKKLIRNTRKKMRRK